MNRVDLHTGDAEYEGNGNNRPLSSLGLLSYAAERVLQEEVNLNQPPGSNATNSGLNSDTGIVTGAGSSAREPTMLPRPSAPLTTDDLLRMMLEQNQRRDEQMATLLQSVVQSQPTRSVQAQPEYQIMPDLNQSIPFYDAEGNSSKASSWLRAIESTASLHRWPEIFKLDSARTHLTGAATHWYNARSFHSWLDFTTQFKKSFVGGSSLPERWKKMQLRVQTKGESTNLYFHEKVMLCQDLDLDFDDLKKQLIIGLWSRQLCAMLMARQHMDTDELLEDIRSFEEVDNERNERISYRKDKQTKPVLEPNRNTRHYHPIKQENHTNPKDARNTTAASVTQNKSSTFRNDKSTKCYNCGRYGHIANDCDTPKQPYKCTNCNQIGHTNRYCTNTRSATGAETTNNQNVVGASNDTEDSPLSKLLKETKIKGKIVMSMIDTGSSSCTIQASAAIKCGLDIGPSTETLSGFGNANLAPVKVLGETRVDIEIDGVVGENVLLLVVPDIVQPVELLVGRTWTELPYIAYVRIDNTFKVGYRNDMPFRDLIIDCVKQPAKLKVARDQVLKQNSVNFVQVRWSDDPETEGKYNQSPELVIPIMNESKNDSTLVKGEYIDRICLVTGENSPKQNKNGSLRDDPLTLEEVNIGSEINPVQQEELLTLLNDFKHCFARNLSELGCTDLVSMDIQLKDGEQPFHCKPYKTTASEREEIREIVGQWKDHGIVTETHSPYASPVCLVRKKTGESRLVVDFRKLNSQTVKEHFPLPNIDDQLASLSSSKIFTVLDLAHGYLQLPLNESAKAKTAFITPDETGQFERLIFGLTNGPAVFQRMMNKVLGPLRNTVAVCFLDDLLIHAKDWPEMLVRLRQVLSAISNAKLTLKITKCEFGKSQLEYVGFIIGNGQVQPGPRKVDAIENFPNPRNVHEVRRFLGLTSFFRRFVKRYAHRSESLTKLLRKDVPFTWGREQQEAMDDLKHALTSQPVLAMYNPRARTELHTDASAEGLAGMLLQEGEDGHLHLVFCVSKKTTAAEHLYHSSKLELMAIVWSVDRLRQFLLGISFAIVTDCQALVYLNTMKTKNPQVARWSQLLQEYDITEIRHRAGTKMMHADALSRAPTEDSLDTMETVFDNRLGMFVTLTLNEQVLTMQRSNEDLKRLITILKKEDNERTSEERNLVKHFSLNEGLLTRKSEDGTNKQLFVVPRGMRKSIVVKHHDLMGHFGLDRTISLIKQHYWFPGLRRYVRQHLHQCLECLINKVPSGRKKGFLHPIPPGRRPYEVIHMDHLGPFVKSSKQNQELLVVIDNATKFVHLYPSRSTSSSCVLKAVKELVLMRGLPEKIITDRGSCFTSRAFASYCKDNGIQHTLNSSRYPQANGQVERVNRTLLPLIAIATNNVELRDWDVNIKTIERDLNNTINKTTGKTPFQLLHGYIPRFNDGVLRALSTNQCDEWTEPSELQEEAREIIERKQEGWKTKFNQKRIIGPKYDVGEVVFMQRAPVHTGKPTKSQPKYRGPLVIMEVLPSDTYRVSQLEQGEKGYYYATTAHASQLKGWKCPDVENDMDEKESSENSLSESESPSQGELTDEEIEPQGMQDKIVNGSLRPKRVAKVPAYFADYVVK